MYFKVANCRCSIGNSRVNKECKEKEDEFLGANRVTY